MSASALDQNPKSSEDPATKVDAQLSPTQLSEFAGLTLGEELGRGAYSVVRMASEASGKRLAVKFAVDRTADTKSSAATGCFLSRPLCQMTGSYGEVSLNAAEFLMKQYESWRSIKCQGWPQVHQLLESDGYTAAIMDFVHGTSLRSLLNERKADIGHFALLVEVMQRLETIDSKRQHGDLKPENVLISQDDVGLYILDPGYFGSLKFGGEVPLQVSMTTPDYYPFLLADDMFAAGVILFEIITGQNPLTAENLEDAAESKFIGHELRAKIECARLGSNYFPSKLYNLAKYLTSHKDTLEPKLRDVALGCMGLKLEQGGVLTVRSQYMSFAELKKLLRAQKKLIG